MLSAYMRFKYPNVIDAALAASAPIYMVTFQGSEREFFFSAVTEVSLRTKEYIILSYLNKLAINVSKLFAIPY